MILVGVAVFFGGVIFFGVWWWSTRFNLDIHDPRVDEKATVKGEFLLRMPYTNTGGAGEYRLVLEGLEGATESLVDRPNLYFQLHKGEPRPYLAAGEQGTCVIADLDPGDSGGFTIKPKKPDGETYDRHYVVRNTEATIAVAFRAVEAKYAETMQVRVRRDGVGFTVELVE